MDDDATLIADDLNRQLRSASVRFMDPDLPSADDAVRAIELSRATGVAPTIIAGDLENFDKTNKVRMASELIRDNPAIADYVNRNPLAASVSGDDLGVLDKVTSTLTNIVTAKSAGQLAFEEVYEKERKRQFAEFERAEATYGRLGTAAAMALSDALTLPAAVMAGIAADVGDTAKRLGVPNAWADRLTRDVHQMLEVGTSGAPGTLGAPRNVHGLHPDVVRQINEASRAYEVARPYIEAGKEFPVGIDPTIDKLKVKASAEDLKGLDEATKEAAGSATRERAPEMFRDFVAQQVGRTKIGIAPERVAEIYGDKVPDPNDGKLGWIPNLQEQIRVGLETGKDIEVPLADWLARVEPELAKELHDDIRVRPSGVTVKEAEIAKERETALEPMFSMDRPYENTPDSLMGFRRDGQNKSFDQQNYPIEQDVKVQLPGDEPFVDTIKGMNQPHALERARRNWPDAQIEAVGTVRKSSALEPLFSVGERKLTLQRGRQIKGLTDESIPADRFDMLNETGEKVGYIEMVPYDDGKRVYIDFVGGLEKQGFGPHSFGPGLMRQMIEQIKLAYPNAEQVGGYRVTGAREMADTAKEVWINIDNPKGWETAEIANEFSRILEGGSWETYSPRMDAYIKPRELQDRASRELIDIVREELDRIVPEQVAVQEAERIKGKAGVAGQLDATEPAGAYIRYAETYPIILFSLEGTNPLGSARHEAIHHLRQYGFFSDKEWAALERASAEGKWAEEFGIADRYKAAGEKLMLEESIAEKYRDWANNKDMIVEPELKTIFEKMKAFFEAIKARIGEILGKEPTWEDIFEKVDSGEVGNREGNRPVDTRSYRESLSNEIAVADRDAFAQASAIGMTLDQYKRYRRLINERHELDVAAATRRAVQQEHKKQTAEWKAAEAEIRPQVVADFNNRPDIAADNFFRTGEAFGNKLADRPTIGKDFITPEQAKALPRGFVSAKGMHPDDAAAMFGFKTGFQMVERLIDMEAQQKASGMRPGDFRRRMVNAEVERVMEAKFGSLRENILDAAKDQALSETQLNMLHEETLALASQAGLEFSIDKVAYQRAIRDTFDKALVEDVSSDKFLAAAGRAGRATEDALLKGDPTEAFRQRQRQYNAASYAKLAAELEKQQARFDRLTKRYSESREAPKSVEREFTNQIQRLLQEAGIPLRLTPEEVGRAIDFEGGQTLEAFVTDKQGYGYDIAVPENYRAKAVEDMTVAEWQEFRDAVQSLDYAGREARKIVVAGEKADFADWKQGVIDNIRSLPKRDVSKQEAGGNFLYHLDAPWTRPEEIVKDLDLREQNGPLFNALIVPFAQSKAKAFDMLEGLSAKMGEIYGYGKEWRKSLHDDLPGDFVFDVEAETPMQLTRWNMIRMMLNWGNEGNMTKLSRGIASAPLEGRIADKDQTAAMQARIDQFIQTHATKEDWDFVQQIWDMFDEWQKEADTLFRNTSGVVPKWVEAREIVTPHGNYRGGYFPLIPDKHRLVGNGVPESGRQPSAAAPLGPDYFRATTSRAQYKDRTGATYFVDITGSVEGIAGRMQQHIHDIAYRDFVINASKIIYDRQIMNAIRNHYGSEYSAQFEPWLKAIANEYTIPEKEMQGWNSMLKRFRVNLIAAALPLSYAVNLSPSLGTANVKQFLAFNSNRAANKALVMGTSKEIPHLLYNMDRDITAALGRATGDWGWTDYQRWAMEKMFKPLVWVEQQTRMVTFYGEYMAQKAKGLSDFEAGAYADSIVRERHSAAATGDLPAIMRTKNEWVRVATVMMGYFTTQRNWMRQMPGQLRRGDYADFAKTVWGTIIIASIFNSLLFTKQKQDEPLFKYLGRAVASVPLSMVPVFRDGWNYASEGFRPTSPLMSFMISVGELGKNGWDTIQGKQPKNPVRSVFNAAGLGLGVPGSMQIGRTGEFLHDVATKEQRPKNIVEWMRGIATGDAQLKKR